ncbi:MAG: hypothetical protein K1X64_15805 [Myxococcaceae bacterium]|nr:hypothetical protein [Myxococcaceae bacterium]
MPAGLRLLDTQSPPRIELDDPQPGLSQVMHEVQADLRVVRHLRRDVKHWAVIGSLLTSMVSIAVGITQVVLLGGRHEESEPASARAFQPPSVARGVPVLPSAVVEALAQPVAQVAAKTLEAPSAAFDDDLALREALRLLWRGKARDSLVELDAVLERSPDNVDALVVKSLALIDLRKDKQARQTLVQALKLAPKHPLANVLRGFMAQLKRDVPRALAYYDAYLKGRPRGEWAQEVAFVRESLSSGNDGARSHP